MAQQQQVVGVEINPKFVGALLTEQMDSLLRVFCFYINGEIGTFDMPARENLDSLRHFFTKLNMEETCSSVIIDEVVQGRFYVRSENHYWLYTLLASPGNVLPAYNADICNLPWRTCWRSQEAEVLECGKTGEQVHCFAIRTAVNETDVGRLLQQSKAFLNPIPVQQKRSNKRLYLGVGVGLACLGLPMAVTMFCMNYRVANASLEPVSTPIAAHMESAPPASGSYLLLYNHQITGPFSLKTITEMKASGQINGESLCRAENSTEWVKLDALMSVQPKPQR